MPTLIINETKDTEHPGGHIFQEVEYDFLKMVTQAFAEENMKKPTEQDIARHFLKHREMGYSIAYVLHRSKVRYGTHVAVLVGFFVLFHKTDDLWLQGFSLWAMGMFLGALCRDFGWLRRIKRTWPFTQKITDWKTVEAIAEGKESANTNLEPISGS